MLWIFVNFYVKFSISCCGYCLARVGTACFGLVFPCLQCETTPLTHWLWSKYITVVSLWLHSTQSADNANRELIARRKTGIYFVSTKDTQRRVSRRDQNFLNVTTDMSRRTLFPVSGSLLGVKASVALSLWLIPRNLKCHCGLGRHTVHLAIIKIEERSPLFSQSKPVL